MNREAQLIEAMGLGPVWQARAGWFEDHPARLQAQSIATACPADEPVELAPAGVESITAPPAEPEEISSLAVQTSSTTSVAEPQAAPAVELNWDTLQKAVTNCERCALCKTRSHTVFGRGKQTARWLLIGEAPGEQEDRLGEPFVGRAGHLLENMLAAAKLSSEQDVYIANVLKCRPPSNRNPATDEIAACQRYLQQQIQLIKPEIIVALGRFAAQTLLSSELSISRLRGKVHDYQGIPLIVSYHPAYLLRNPPDKARAWEDWQLAHQTISH